jgi:hypothetical protein
MSTEQEAIALWRPVGPRKLQLIKPREWANFHRACLSNPFLPSDDSRPATARQAVRVRRAAERCRNVLCHEPLQEIPHEALKQIELVGSHRQGLGT